MRRKARRPGTPFASSWWGVRWIRLLESFGWASRLARGREVARAGRVRSLEVGRGGAVALVKGTAAEPYEARIALEPLPARVFAKAVRVMAGKASFAADLLSGRIPPDVESAFGGTGFTLLPEREEDLRFSCTCPDEAKLCKHLAAAFYLVGERLDEDPFLVFLLRGRTREELLGALQVHRARVRGAARRVEGEAEGGPVPPPEPLPEVKPEHFFRPLVSVASLRTTFAPAEHPEAVLTRLGPPPFEDPDAARLLVELHRAIGLGAAERLSEWEWRRLAGRGRARPA